MNYLQTKSLQFQEKINNAPKEPGCYLYLNKKEKIIYIGKAKNIRNRVKSYFINYSKLDSKVQVMIENANDINFITVDSEVEALILETNLIKKYKPKYNILMRDDKSYNWIKMESAIKGIRDFPRIKIIRSTDQLDDPKAEYLGPFPSKLPLKNILKRIRKVFPYVSCNRRLIEINSDPLKVDTNNSVPCLYYHIGLCQAPCASLINKTEYLKNFNNIKKFLKGEKTQIVQDLEKEMLQYSKTFEFEKAAGLRDKINDIKYVTRNISIDNEVDDVIIDELKQQERSTAIQQLIEELNFPLDKLSYHKDFKIECYDISNIQGTNAVGSMTVMVDGQLRKDLYRKFKIKMKNEPNDFAMLQEVLSRRFSHLNDNIIKSEELNNNTEQYSDQKLKKGSIRSSQNLNDSDELYNSAIEEYTDELSKETNEKELKINKEENDPSFSIKPDLIIIDGGKGQLASTYKVLKNLNLDNIIPIVGLAKREEEIFKVQWQFNTDDWPDLALKRFKRVFLNRKSEALYLVQRIRDEAHRFGITYHRKLRSKQMLNKMKLK